MIFSHVRSVSVAMLLATIVVCQAQTVAPGRISGAVDTSQLVRLAGSVHPFAKPEFDQGRLNGNTTIHAMSLTFKHSPAQQKALEKLLTEQQDPKSPKYHKWLTPEQFADRFGLTSSDVAQVTRWLESEGLVVDRVARSRTQVSFSGSVARIESVFGTEIHSYLIGGEKHFANATELLVPTALQDVIFGVRNLDDFHPKPRNTGSRRIPASPNFTSDISGNHYVAPEDFATIYEVKALYAAGFDGAGEKIAVVGDSAITASNIATFRSLAGLSANNPSEVLVPNSGTATVPSTGEQVEAYLDLEWSGAIAKSASIIYVYVGNNPNYSVWDALQYAIDNKLAPVVSTSFGYCEQGLGSATALIIQGWAQQANSQGQTISAAAGDSGAADCDGSNVQSATQGLAVDVPAAIPEVTGVGGGEFTGDTASTSTTTYWNGTNDSAYGSALIYIPEEAWNDTTESIANGGGLSAGGGGASTLFSKPSWQTGTGVPNDGHRDVPDVSLNASPVHDSYLICDGTDENGIQSCTSGFRDSQNYLDVVGGTSVGAPTFAGIVALLNQATKSNGLGNINSALYSLAGSSAANAFHDVTSGDNKVPCTKGTTNCPNGGTIGFSAGTGYDQASGLGSLDVYNLATNWSGYSSSPSYSASASPTSVTISSPGQSGTSTITVRATGGFSGTVNLSCSISSSTAKMGCSLSPLSVSLDSTTTSATATLTITTTGSSVRFGNSASLRRGGQFNWLEGICGVVLGCVGVLGFPVRLKYRRSGLLLVLFTLLALGTGCGGGHAGTPKGNYTTTITASSGSTTHTAIVSVSIQ
jgi:subtilase family serine protease